MRRFLHRNQSLGVKTMFEKMVHLAERLAKIAPVLTNLALSIFMLGFLFLILKFSILGWLMLFWKKMPSLWIGNSIAEFSSLDTAKGIAALKIYMDFCLFSKKSDAGIRTIEFTFSNLCNSWHFFISETSSGQILNKSSFTYIQ